MNFSLPRFVVFASAVVLAPSLAFAAYNHVTLTTDAVISVGGYTLNVSGSSATIQSIVVNSGSFSVTLASGSSFSVSSPTLQQFSSDVTSDVTNNACTGSASSISLAYCGAGTVTNVITPSATVCTTSSGGGGGGSGGGGGNGPIAGSLGSGALAPGYIAPRSQIISPNANVTYPHATTTSSTSTRIAVPRASHILITRNHHLGDHGDDIRTLQQFLNTHGFRVASSGPGSPGNETTKFGALTYQALVRFQKAHGLPATGYLGPMTRSVINTQ
jgi:hypothetical protein